MAYVLIAAGLILIVVAAVLYVKLLGKDPLGLRK